MSVSIVAAIAQNDSIGKDGGLPWYLPEDLRHFKEVTAGKVVVMGRKTWESLPAKFCPLPDRVNAVITHQPDLPVPAGVEVYGSVDAALAAHSGDDVAVIGGAQIFELTMGRADTLYITHIHRAVDGDAFFPKIDPATWKETAREDHPEFSFVTYRKK